MRLVWRGDFGADGESLTGYAAGWIVPQRRFGKWESLLE